MKKTCILILLTFFFLQSFSQIDPARITIARDSFGVPHIFAPTDPEVAYGLAWAHAEDDFESIQLMILSGKARLGTAYGKRGAEADYVVNLLRCRDIVDSQWDSLSPDFIALIRGYIEGINTYAKTYPERVSYKEAFPVNEREYLTSVVFSLSVFSGIDEVLPAVLSGKAATIPGFNSQGSNAFAFNRSRTTSGETFLAINAHQPQSGPTAFYEAHVQSEQGWNMLGGLFPGGCLIFHGTNENLGWAHTVNYQDKIDLFQLEMNPDKKNQYKFDGQWLDLEVRKAKLHVKGVPVTVDKKVYWSKYGATVKTDKGVFALRLAANMDCRALEEWYRMNKARNFTEFYKAVSQVHLPMFNIMYADRYDTIFYISNGKMPRRNPDPAYNWKSTIPGNTSATLWTEFKPIGELPQYVNPASGYLFNTNHSPFLATDPSSNLDPKKFDKNDGYETYHNNRSARVMELMKDKGRIDYETFKSIKFDQQLPKELKYTYAIDSLLLLDPAKYPDIKEEIENLRNWDHKAITSSVGAGEFSLIYDYYKRTLAGQPARKITTPEAVEGLRYVRSYEKENFGKQGITLGEIQKLVRGDDVRPAWGLPDVLTAAYTEPYKNGMRKVVSGDAYICLVRYPKEGLPIIESVNTFGASADPASPHFKDQMGRFIAQQPKHMTLDKAEILRTAERVYHPEK